MSILRSAAVTLCLAGGIFVWTNMQVANHRAEAIENYHLSAAAVTFMDACTASLKANKLGISRMEESGDARHFNTKVCGCIAAKVGEGGANDRSYAVSQDIFTYMVEERAKDTEMDPAKVLPALMKIGGQHGIEGADVFPLMNTVGTALATCARDGSV